MKNFFFRHTSSYPRLQSDLCDLISVYRNRHRGTLNLTKTEHFNFLNLLVFLTEQRLTESGIKFKAGGLSWDSVSGDCGSSLASWQRIGAEIVELFVQRYYSGEQKAPIEKRQPMKINREDFEEAVAKGFALLSRFVSGRGVSLKKEEREWLSWWLKDLLFLKISRHYKLAFKADDGWRQASDDFCHSFYQQAIEWADELSVKMEAHANDCLREKRDLKKFVLTWMESEDIPPLLSDFRNEVAVYIVATLDPKLSSGPALAKLEERYKKTWSKRVEQMVNASMDFLAPHLPPRSGLFRSVWVTAGAPGDRINQRGAMEHRN